MATTGIYGQKIDGTQALAILAIARQLGVKAEPVKGGILWVRPMGRGYTLKFDT